MEDKTFVLITKMYDEFSKRFNGIDSRLDGIDNRLKKVEIIIEHDIKNAIRTLFDGYNQVYEAVIELKKSVDRLTKTVETHDMEIAVLKKALAGSL